jgi:hypothetical protein
MERRFQFDFGNVRIHSGEREAASTAAIGARAYTVGNDIVLSRHEKSDTAGGLGTLAHELAHVVQQSRVFRSQGLNPPVAVDAAEREANAAAEAVSNGASLAPIKQAPVGVTLQTLPDGGIQEADVRDAGTSKTGVAGPTDAGPTDAGGGGTEAEPTDAGGGSTKAVCGPDVTKQVQDVVALTKSDFAGWSAGTRVSHCDALDSLLSGAAAWDIYELHNNDWIYKNYRPACATIGATPPCGSTVQVGTECYYAGSPNYVIFGVMCKACYDHYTAKGDSTGMARFTQSKMEYWINYYKGTGPSGKATPSANFGPSRDWAIAGYLGWPSGGTPPAGDRNSCSPSCATPYSGAAFTYVWHTGPGLR